MKRVLYVHGFRGSAYGRGYKRVLNSLPEGYKLFSIDYDEADCSHAREQILNFIDEFKIDLVIGSSLGGGYHFDFKWDSEICHQSMLGSASRTV